MRPQAPLLAALALALAVVCVATPRVHAAAPRTPDEQRETLMGLLATVDIKLSRAALDTVGDDVSHQLVLIADLPRVPTIVRMRAVAALAYYPSTLVRSYLVSRLHERSLIGTPLGTELRRQAVRSLGAGFGADAVDDVIELLGDREPLIREAVALALGDAGSPHALPTLEGWLGREPELFVRAAIDHAISQLRGR